MQFRCNHAGQKFDVEVEEQPAPPRGKKFLAGHIVGDMPTALFAGKRFQLSAKGVAATVTMAADGTFKSDGPYHLEGVPGGF